jgi:F0F1-type ATP synthase assembly protein I
MEFVVKLIVTNAVIICCAQIGRRFPTLGGLIATMPLTSLLVLLWLYRDNPGNYRLMTDYTRGVLWGIIPTILFFGAAYLCFRRELPLALVLTAGSGVWLGGALVHQWLVR